MPGSRCVRRSTATKSPAVTTRSAHFDRWARQFLAVHPEAVVLHLGCGLDSRFFRLAPGPGVEWYDIDYPDVARLRTQLYPAAEHYHVIPASVTDPTWLQDIQTGRPTLMIAEGLTMYLTEQDGVALLRERPLYEPFDGRADAQGIGERDRRFDGAELVDLGRTRELAERVADEHGAGHLVLKQVAAVWHDGRDTGANVVAGYDRGVTDLHAGHVSDGVECAGREDAGRDSEGSCGRSLRRGRGCAAE